MYGVWCTAQLLSWSGDDIRILKGTVRIGRLFCWDINQVRGDEDDHVAHRKVEGSSNRSSYVGDERISDRIKLIGQEGPLGSSALQSEHAPRTTSVGREEAPSLPLFHETLPLEASRVFRFKVRAIGKWLRYIILSD